LTAEYWIKHLKLSSHPEGGYYRETHKADLTIRQAALPAGFHGDRPASTAIYFLLAETNFSAFHRLASDELWHFYAGDCLVVYVIDPEGKLSELYLGHRPEDGESFQVLVKAGCWFGSRLKHGGGFALVGCTVAPGFEFADFELAKRSELSAAYPQHKGLIKELTRG
jgi:predicted cupin superfamily sugar epimerase